MKYLKEFVITSSVALYLPAFYTVNKIKDEKGWKFPYHIYTFYLPLVTALANVVSLIVRDYFGLLNTTRFLLLTIITWLFTTSIVKYYELYNFTNDEYEMNKYRFKLFVNYFVFWNIIIYNLEKYI